jgi:co-chaperonin GroES (HSP10)
VERDTPPAPSQIIIAPDSAKIDRSETGKILAVGPRAPSDFWPERRVIFGTFAGTEIKIDEERAWLMHPEEIKAFFLEESNVEPEAG